MEFPRHCHKPNGLFVVVKNQDEFDAALAAGFAAQPEAHVEQPVQVSLAEAVKDAAPVDETAAEAPKKRGRKAKD